MRLNDTPTTGIRLHKCLSLKTPTFYGHSLFRSSLKITHKSSFFFSFLQTYVLDLNILNTDIFSDCDLKIMDKTKKGLR